MAVGYQDVSLSVLRGISMQVTDWEGKKSISRTSARKIEGIPLRGDYSGLKLYLAKPMGRQWLRLYAKLYGNFQCPWESRGALKC